MSDISIHGDIKINHRVIGHWQAQCQPGKDGIHPYRWGATLNGVSVRGVLTHTRADGALVLASKVCAEAARMLSEPESAENGTPDLVAALRESIERARERRRTEPRPEFKALIDAFQPEYDALLKEDR